MEPKKRNQSNIRWSEEDLKILLDLKKDLGLTVSGIVRFAIRDLHSTRKDNRNASYTRKLL